MVKKFSKIGVCMVFVLSMILPQAAVSKAKMANPYTGKKYVYCSNYKDGIELYGKDGSKKKKYTLIKKERKVKSKKEKEVVLCQRMAGVPLCDG